MAVTEWEDVYNDLASMLDGADDFEIGCSESDPFVILPSFSSSIPATISITAINDDTEQTAKKPKTTEFKPKSKRRNSPRDELRNLQVTVRQLETRLAMLLNRSSKELKTAETGGTVASRVWEAIASRQLRELDRSERENARLRARAQEQLRLIRSLERLVMKRSKVPSYIPQPSPLDGVRDAVNDLVLEKQIEKEVFAMLTGIDCIADDPRFNAISNTPAHMSKVLSHANDSLVMETLYQCILPFDHQVTADALWTMWKTVPMDLEHEMARDNMRSTDSALWRVDAGSLEMFTLDLGEESAMERELWEEMLAAYGDIPSELDAVLTGLDEVELPFLQDDSPSSVQKPRESSEADMISPALTIDSENGSAAKKTQIKTTRKRGKSVSDEVKELRATVEELETRVNALRGRSRRDSNIHSQQSTSSTEASKAWERIAIRQIKALGESEFENARLQAMVEVRSRLITSLEDLLTKKKPKKQCFRLESPWDGLVRDAVEDPVLELEMGHIIDTMANDVDRIFADALFKSFSDEPIHVSEVIYNGGRPVFKSLNARFLPFDYRVAADVHWNRVHASPLYEFHKNDVQIVGDLVRQSVAGDFDGLNFDDHQAIVRYRGEILNRRIVRDDCVIFLSTLFITLVRVGDKPLGELNLRLRMWNMFQPVLSTTNEDATSDHSTSRRLFYSLCMPQTFAKDETLGLGFDAGSLSKLITDNYEIHIEENNQDLENRLLDRLSDMRLVETPT
ncbi:hypothetical protein Poli38472_011833 [Pythium oligandrum]|uniref:Uncharacterized protein n=1 Tax=Pythium oligandrum TaxID=41045 RepID=A0A8K1FCE9_PYTOL|nr:hypothetical protein Poli38472_011833 [Pythium oligandrum]|eukprot:TMW58245.1 hypothetical protein Poli38472_011833 [Pythium oligandrum]